MRYLSSGRCQVGTRYAFLLTRKTPLSEFTRGFSRGIKPACNLRHGAADLPGSEDGPLSLCRTSSASWEMSVPSCSSPSPFRSSVATENCGEETTLNPSYKRFRAPIIPWISRSGFVPHAPVLVSSELPGVAAGRFPNSNRRQNTCRIACCDLTGVVNCDTRMTTLLL